MIDVVARGLITALPIVGVLLADGVYAQDGPATNRPFRYSDASIAGTSTAEFSMSEDDCRRVCASRVGCAGFDHRRDANICRIFVSARQARYEVGSISETRHPVVAEHDPIGHPGLSICVTVLAPSLRAIYMPPERVLPAIDLCGSAAEDQASSPDAWGYYAFAISHGDSTGDEAWIWATRSAEKGAAIGQYVRGLLLQEGIRVTKDLPEAARQYKLAADQGFGPAQIEAASAYLDGRGITRNVDEAVRLLRLAAEQGYPDAQYDLGTMFEEGNGVEQDIDEARRLFKLAADQGEAPAQARLDRLAGKQ